MSLVVKKLAALDILRGAAALAIAWYHSRSDLWIGFKAIHQNPSAYSAFNRIISFVSLPVSQAGSMVIVFFILRGPRKIQEWLD
jgi:peptidoglycan/LPS O-acetylase OafA/YrhL